MKVSASLTTNFYTGGARRPEVVEDDPIEGEDSGNAMMIEDKFFICICINVVFVLASFLYLRIVVPVMMIEI